MQSNYRKSKFGTSTYSYLLYFGKLQGLREILGKKLIDLEKTPLAFSWLTALIDVMQKQQNEQNNNPQAFIFKVNRWGVKNRKNKQQAENRALCFRNLMHYT